jgi:YD repeat-containing protein
MFNYSFDSDFEILAFEMVGYDPGSNTLRRINVDAYGNLTTSDFILTAALDYDANGNMIYYGLAAIGSAKSDPAWQIRKFTYDTNGRMTDRQFAGGTNEFTNIWDNRASITPYS